MPLDLQRRTRSLLRSAGTHGLGQVGNALLAFSLIPVLTRALDQGSYGVLSMVSIALAVFAPLITLNVRSAVGRRVFDQERFPLPTYVSTALAIVAAGAAGWLVFVWALRHPLGSLLHLPPRWLPLIVACATATGVIGLALTLLQFSQRARAYVALQLSTTSSEVALTLILVLVYGLDWEGRVLAILVVGAVFALGCLIALARLGMLTSRLSAVAARDALIYGGKIVPHSLGLLVVAMTDRVLVSHQLGIEATGVYAVAAQVAAGLKLTVDAYNRAWTPWLFARLKDATPEAKLGIVRRIYLAQGAILLAALGLALLAEPLLTILVPDAYVGAVPALRWLALAYAAYGMYALLNSQLYFFERSGLVSVGTLLAGSLNLAVSPVLIARHGLVGAAQGTAVAFGACYLITWYMVARVHPLPWLLKSDPRRAEPTQPIGEPLEPPPDPGDVT